MPYPPLGRKAKASIGQCLVDQTMCSKKAAGAPIQPKTGRKRVLTIAGHVPYHDEASGALQFTL